jgi:dihydroorotate dehydrogenase electron transfer subunit
MKHQEITKVLDNVKVAPEHYKLTLSSQRISKESNPGQFVMVKCGTATDPLLRRPISLHNIDRTMGKIELLYRVVGKGTLMLSEKKPGEDVDIIGPLGNGFKIDLTKDVAIIIGGGAGIAPLYALAKNLISKVKAVYVLIGANNINAVLCEDDFKKLGCETVVTTDDGTYGKHGLVTDILLDIIDSKVVALHSHVYACGPRPMIKSLQSISHERMIPMQVSLEEWMACGIGACNGCTIETKKGLKKVCSDGPVFDIGDL